METRENTIDCIIEFHHKKYIKDEEDKNMMKIFSEVDLIENYKE